MRLGTARHGEGTSTRRWPAAARAFEPWRKTPATARGTPLARRLEASASEFAAAETAHNGKTPANAEFDLASTAACLDYLRGRRGKAFGEDHPVSRGLLCVHAQGAGGGVRSCRSCPTGALVDGGKLPVKGGLH